MLDVLDLSDPLVGLYVYKLDQSFYMYRPLASRQFVWVE